MVALLEQSLRMYVMQRLAYRTVSIGRVHACRKHARGKWRPAPVEAFQHGFGLRKADAAPVRQRNMLGEPLPLQPLASK